MRIVDQHVEVLEKILAEDSLNAELVELGILKTVEPKDLSDSCSMYEAGCLELRIGLVVSALKAKPAVIPR